MIVMYGDHQPKLEDAGRYAPLLQEYAYLQYNNLFDADHRLQSFWGEETP